MRFITLLLVALCFGAQAQTQIKITGGTFSEVPIAVVPFETGQFISYAPMHTMIDGALEHSGDFKALDARNLLSRPIIGGNIIWRDFRVLKQEYVVLGRMEPVELGSYLVSYELWDVIKQENVFSRMVKTNLPPKRLSQVISDDIYQAITGVPGIASTRMLYVTSQNYGGYFEFKLKVADSDFKSVQTVVTSSEPILSPTWSPDGKRFAYSTYVDGQSMVFIQDLKSAQRQRIQAFEGINGAPSWSPNGNKLALTLSKDGNTEIYLYDLMSKRFQRLTTNPAIDTEPSWFPDGRSLVFTSNRGGSPQLYKLSISSGKVKRLTFDGKYNTKGQITPDGKNVVFVHKKGGTYNIALKGLDSNVFKLISQSTLDESPSISPNGLYVVYATQVRGQNTLAVSSVKTDRKKFIPTRSAIREPAWSPFFQKNEKIRKIIEL